jgi:5'(3')-deoxyribonucleotidase
MRAREFIGREDYDPNGTPPGPEFRPTMPAGTVRVDVSDVYDWYKLGQHISNLKGLGRHDFGQGPPSAIINFGSEEAEHQYIQDLQRTGLSTTDIDPAAHGKIKGQKTDPTYNVGESESPAGAKPHLFLDMDGVQADFFLQWAKMFGFKNYRDMGDVAAQTANIMKLVDKGDEFVEEFFATLPMLRGGARLLNFLHKNNIPYTILSAPLRHRFEASTAGKRRWLDKHTPGVSQDAIFTSDKHKYARAGGRANVLVDDHGEKIAKWKARGGIGIKHDDATTDSTIEQLSKIYLQ